MEKVKINPGDWMKTDGLSNGEAEAVFNAFINESSIVESFSYDYFLEHSVIVLQKGGNSTFINFYEDGHGEYAMTGREVAKEEFFGGFDANQEWKDGLPPVGVECEARVREGDTWYPWFPCIIKAEYDQQLWIMDTSTMKDYVYPASCVEFRPIDTRTDEEKAVDKLKADIKWIVSCTNADEHKALMIIDSAKRHGFKWVGNEASD